MTQVNCGAKHTKPQIPDADWKCPGCGVGVEYRDGGRRLDGFIVCEPCEPDGDCPLLHDDDLLHCGKCEKETTGRAFARHYAKVKSLVRCEHCKGTGMVKQGEGASVRDDGSHGR